MKEKLIELVKPWVAHHANAMANDLIANGVTVRDKAKWKLRIDDCDCEYVMCSACGAVFYAYDEDTIDFTPNFCVGCGADMR